MSDITESEVGRNPSTERDSVAGSTNSSRSRFVRTKYYKRAQCNVALTPLSRDDVRFELGAKLEQETNIVKREFSNSVN